MGGILGGVMEMGQVHGVLTGIQEGMQFFLNSVRTWMLPLMAICGVIALVLCEQYMGRLKRAGEAWEQGKSKPERNAKRKPKSEHDTNWKPKFERDSKGKPKFEREARDKGKRRR